MTNNMVHIERFEESTRAAYRLLLLANTPEGFLRLFSKFLSSLEEDKTRKNAYNILKARLVQEDQGLQKHKEGLIEWMKTKLEIMRKLNCYKAPEVKTAIDEANLILSGQSYEISSGGFLSTLTWYFEKACRSAAFFGYTPEFAEWLKVTAEEQVLMFPEPVFKKPVFNKEFSPFSNQGKLGCKRFCKRLGHGFIKVVIKNGVRFRDGKGSLRYVFEWGHVDAIMYPESLQIWRKNQNLVQSQIRCDYKAEENLRYLLLLSQFERLPFLPLPSLPQPKTVFEAENLCNQQLLQYYLSGFRTVSWNEAPISLDQIMSKVGRLLAFLELESNNTPFIKRSPRTAKEDAHKFVRETLEKTWDGLEKEGKRPRDYQELITAVLKGLIKAPKERVKAISDTLIKKEVRKFAKIKKWRPVRGKDKNRRHNI